jgi:hypothetical protein
MERIPHDVAGRMGYYVYAYINPLNGQIFYVGKGRGRRALSHFQGRAETRTAATIKQIQAAGKQPQVDILAHGLHTPEAALKVEAAVIDALGLWSLTNRIRGWGSSRYGRTPLRELIATYRRRPARINDPAILVRINELYRPSMTPAELYDATRGNWRLGPKKERARYAFAVFEGVVREVYEIMRWLPAGSTLSSRDPRGVRSPGRWEFVGRLAPERVRRRYVDRDVRAHFKRGAQNPIAYVGIR